MTDRPEGGMVERRSGGGAATVGPVLSTVPTGNLTPDRGGAR
jgi:hypothetical protein